MEFLVLNKVFPRSVFFCIKQAENCLYKISGGLESGFRNSAEKAMGELRSKLEFADVNDVIQGGLHEYLDDLEAKINQISNKVDVNFFQIKNNFASQTQTQE